MESVMTGNARADRASRRGDPRGAGGRDRRALARLGVVALAGTALVGVSAALTSAAWTDQVLFASTASTGTANLQGSIDGVTWVESSSAGEIELDLPAAADLRPGDSRTTTIRIRNTGSLPVTLSSDVAGSGALFTGSMPVTAVLAGLPATVAGGSTVTGTLTIAAPAWTGQLHQGESGSVTVTITGAV